MVQSRRKFLASLGIVTGGALLVACGQTASPTSTPAPPAKPTEAPKPATAEPTKPSGAPAATTAPAAAATKPAAASTTAPAAAATTAPAAATGAPVAATKPAAAATGKQIKYQQRAASVEDFVRKKYAPEFEQKTGTKVVIEDIPNNEYFQKVVVLAAANQLGDLVFGFTYPWLPSWASKNLLRSIDAEAQSAQIDLNGFYKGVIDACKFEGKLYGLPTAGHPSSVNLYFNRDILQAAGIPAPDSKGNDDAWKFEDVLENAKKLTKDAGGKKQWGYMAASDFILYTLSNIRPFGADLHDVEGKKAAVASPEGVKAYTYYHGLIYKDKVSPSPADLGQGVEAQSLFTNGELAMFTRATSEITTFPTQIKDKFKWGVYPMPPGPAGNRGATTFANTTSVTSQAKEVPASVEFLKLISSKEAGVEKLLMNSGSPGMRPDVFNDPKIVELYPWFKYSNKVMNEMKAPYIPANLKTAELQALVPQIESEIWLNKVNGEEGAKKLNAAIDELLKQPK